MPTEENKTYKNIQDWEEKIIKIFPMAIPNECTWYEEIDILNVLFTLCSKNIANIFYPDGKKLGLYGVDFSREDNCIELITENTIDIISPIKLSFHYYDEAFEWSYFRLETDNLHQISDNKKDLYKEELICLDNGEYIDVLNCSKGNIDKERVEELINSDKLVNRYLNKSSFLIFARSSYFKDLYNKSFNSYSDEELSNLIENMIVSGNI